MNLQSLIFSRDDNTTRVLRRVLGGLEIGIEHCGDVDSAIQKLTRNRFEAIMLDYEDEAAAKRMLASVQSAPGNRHALQVAILSGRRVRQSDFAKHADFVLYKPVSFAQAQRSFHAARYLMKCECRRNFRVGVQFPVSLLADSGKAIQRAVTSDLSEDGMAVRFRPTSKRNTSLRFTLPGTDHVLECKAELAWESSQSHAGFRFVDLSREDREHLRAWLSPYYFDYQIPASPPMERVLPGFLPATE